MFTEYIQAALERAQYKLIAILSRMHAKELIEVLEEWIAARLMWGLPIPLIDGQSIEFSI